MLWTIRAARDEDFAFIMDSWQKSTRDEPYSGNIPNNLSMSVIQESVRQLIARGAKVRVAVNPERDTQVLGWACTEEGRNGETVVHMLYTKQAFRRMKIATQLLAAVGVNPTDPFPFTYRTRLSRAFPNARHMPGIQRRQKI